MSLGTEKGTKQLHIQDCQNFASESDGIELIEKSFYLILYLETVQAENDHPDSFKRLWGT